METKKRNKSLAITFLWCLAGLFACVSCSNEDMQDNMHVQLPLKLHFNVEKVPFNNATTRSAGEDFMSWKDNDIVYIYFNNGQYAYAKYLKQDGWTLVYAAGTIPSSGTCKCRHFANAVGYQSNNTVVTLNSSSVDFSANSVDFTYSEDYGMAINAKLAPNCSRVRFKGVSGEKISVSGFIANSQFNAVAQTMTTPISTISLTVGSDGYTPYIYGMLPNGNLVITRNGSEYVKSVRSDALKVGQSGYIVLDELKNSDATIHLELSREDFGSDNCLDGNNDAGSTNIDREEFPADKNLN